MNKTKKTSIVDVIVFLVIVIVFYYSWHFLKDISSQDFLPLTHMDVKEKIRKSEYCKDGAWEEKHGSYTIGDILDIKKCLEMERDIQSALP